MAPVPLNENSNIVPITYFALNAIGALTLVTGIIWRLRRSSKFLGPVHNTRHHQSQRRDQVIVFAALAGISFVLVSYYNIVRYLLSYSFWHDHHGAREDIPNILPGRTYAPSNDELQLGRWFNSQNIPLQFYEIISSDSKRFWWGQQLFSGLFAWSTFLGVESRRRELPTWIKLAFLFIAQFMSLSVAQNLFYITLILTPIPLIPLSSNDALNAPGTWTYVVLAVLGSLCTYDLSAMQYTRVFYSSLFTALLVIPFALAMIPTVRPPYFSNTTIADTRDKMVPSRWTVKHQSVHEAHQSYTVVFTSMSLFAFALHGWSILKSFSNSTPYLYDPYEQHHSIFSWPFHASNTVPEPTTFERIEITLAQLLGAFGDHPAVNAVVWDVSLSGISLGIWCIVRGADVTKMLECSIWPWQTGPENKVASESASKRVAFNQQARDEDDASLAALPTKRTRKNASPPASPSKKGRGRPKKDEKDDESFVDTVTGAAAKTVQSASDAFSETTLRRSTRARNRSAPVDEDSEEDDEYVPTKTVAEEVANREHEEDSGGAESEAGALAWGLWIVGGLGLATSSALGSEIVGA
ncbi:MAG: hypothetical protein M1820_003538 [Bogoriella megaspora]|nr:MAG: hypothetical protein M1820_003538 [Bogoriella megaspora]